MLYRDATTAVLQPLPIGTHHAFEAFSQEQSIRSNTVIPGFNDQKGKKFGFLS